MAYKVFEVGDVLPATTQLRISWDCDFTEYNGFTIGMQEGKGQWNRTSLIEVESWATEDMAYHRVDIFADTTIRVWEWNYIPPYTDANGGHNYIDIDTSSWSIGLRTVEYISSSKPVPFSWEDLNPAPSGFSVTFEENGGTSVTDLTEQTNLPNPLPTPTKANNVFAGWYLDSSFTQKAVAGATIESNVTLYAKWYTPTSWINEIADSIREKEGSSEPIRKVDFADRITALPSPKEEETKTLTPNFSSGNQVITPTSGKVLSQVTLTKPTDLLPENIKKGVNIFGVVGTYEGEPSGFEVAVTFANVGYAGPCNVYVYDGNNTSGTLLDTIIRPENILKTYNVASGNLYIYANEDLDPYNYWVTNPSTSGGVTVTNKSDYGLPYFILCSVTADGSLNTGNYGCFVKGTQITLANGTTKNVEDIDYNDKLLAYNFDEGKLDTANILWIAKESKAPVYWEVIFSDNTKLGLVGAKNKSHRLFNLEQGKFAYPQDFNEGEHTIKEDGSLVTITSCVKLQKEVTYYNLATSIRLNNYANGILTGSRLTNIYPIENMKYVKDNRQLVSREEYAEIPDNYFEGLRLAEQPLETQANDVNYFNTLKEHVIHNYIEHEKNWQGAKDYKQWEFKKGRKENL